VTKGRKVALRIVGTTGLVLSAYGVYYTLSYLTVLHSEPPGAETPYFREAYYPMFSICLAFYALLAFFGAQFLQLKTRLRFWFLGLLILELGYFFSVGFLWRLNDEKIALSIAAATGVANGGLVAQGITLFPIWAAIIVFWAHSNSSSSGRAEALRST
jgi:hypothetical protein